MKEILEPVPAEQIVETEGYANRKLIRPSLNRNDHGHNNHGNNHGTNHNSSHGTNQVSGERRERPAAAPKKVAPSEQTNAENFYYQKQMQTKTPARRGRSTRVYRVVRQGLHQAEPDGRAEPDDL